MEQTTTKIQTIMVDPTSSSREGQVTFLSSDFTSVKNEKILFIAASPHINQISCTIGRPGGTRTPNKRIWSPPLYHWSYWPSLHLYLFCLFVRRVSTALSAIFTQCKLAEISLFGDSFAVVS